MWRTLRRGTRRLAAAGVIAGLVTLAAAAPAYSDHNNAGAYGTSYVDGKNTVTDDFSDHHDELGHSLCYGCADSRNTDLVVMWQAILYAHLHLDASDIDGQFGPRTRDATIAWQRERGIGADGVVGPATWNAADNRLSLGSNGQVTYSGPAGSEYGWVRFCRGSCSCGRTCPIGGGAYQLIHAYNMFDGTVRFSDGAHRIDFYSRSLQVRIG